MIVDFCEFKFSLVYILSSRLGSNLQWKFISKTNEWMNEWMDYVLIKIGSNCI